jgi:hypothetical protein
MSNSKRFLVAGAGAIVPFLVNLTAIDLTQTLQVDH